MKKYLWIVILIAIGFALVCNINSSSKESYVMVLEDSTKNSKSDEGGNMIEIKKSEEEWKKILSPEQYKVLRGKGTERPFTGKFYKNDETGIYVCAACGNELFSSETKYESGSGWPSYWEPISENSVKLVEDTSHGMIRTEVVCGRCGGHLGHVFDDGPQPTGKRYCINSISLDFKKDTTE